MIDREKWEQILIEVVEKATKSRTRPAPAAILAHMIRFRAAKDGLSFPPSDRPTMKLKELLDEFKHVVITTRREGGDLWVAPKDSPSLFIALSPGSESRQSGIRPDLFSAFTDVHSNSCYWYDRSTDRAIRLPEAATFPEGHQYIQIPKRKFEEAKEFRLRFASHGLEPSVQADLCSALESPNPLKNFASAVRANGLQSKWHEFRANGLIQAINEWAKSADIPWNDSWITSASGVPVEAGENVSEQADKPDSAWRDTLSSFLGALEESDLARISIPLDIVAKAMSRAKE